MSTYIRGPICGVSNCPSRLWRIIDGRRTCQYGHVMEGDVEFNNDDDDVAASGVITRRLNLTTNATGSFQSSFNLSQSQNIQNSDRIKKLDGYDAHVLFLKAFQYILKRQIKQLVENMFFPSEFENIVKILWGFYLKSLCVEDNSDINAIKSRVRGHFKISMLSSISLLYMATIHMGLPVYICDFIRWISSSKLIFFNASDILPASWQEKLPNHYLGLLEGGKVPHDGQLFQKISQICERTNFSELFDHQLAYEGLIFKLLISAVLPPEFYILTVNMIKKMDTDEHFKLLTKYQKDFKKYFLWAELRVIAYFILTVRWVLLIDTKNYSLKWIQTLAALPRNLDRSEHTRDQHMTVVSSTIDPSDIPKWDDLQTSEYLDWVQEKLLPIQKDDKNDKIDHKIAMRKLHKIFPLDSDFQQSKPGAQHSSYIEELQEKYNFLQITRHTNDMDPVVSKESSDNRTKAINALERTLVNKFACEHGCSVEQLDTTIDYIEKHCKTKSD